MEELLPASQPRVAQTLRDHTPTNSPRLAAGSYCGAMARKIVTGQPIGLSGPSRGRSGAMRSQPIGPGR
ncbi:hypothetical protein BZL30_5782 [Mycobacterium kansasii]|uniref:Uncharacterized protein n=1 Tax=Mycobacterium kansasii TaxID=1768 RepID=A0A1V3WY32_MYCKA|nr:hypothetical protein BZL30_5782 [Mycobacterium kansasii]